MFPHDTAAVCVSPWADLECTGDSAGPGAIDDPILQLDSLVGMGRMYAEGAEARTPYEFVKGVVQVAGSWMESLLRSGFGALLTQAGDRASVRRSPRSEPE